MKMWMFNCRQIARLVSESMDHELPLNRRIGVRFHMMMCRHCGRYEKQLHHLRRLARSRSVSSGAYTTATLEDISKERLRRLMAKQVKK